MTGGSSADASATAAPARIAPAAQRLTPGNTDVANRYGWAAAQPTPTAAPTPAAPSSHWAARGGCELDALRRSPRRTPRRRAGGAE